MSNKRCTTCGFECSQEEVREFFYRQGSKRFKSQCKTCEKIRVTLARKTPKGKAIALAAVIKYQQTPRGKVNKNANGLKWAKENPERANANTNRRRARKLSLPNNFTKADIDFALNYWKYSCPVCQADLNNGYHLDHHIPLTNTNCPGTLPTNIVPLCGFCNDSKSNKHPEIWYQDKLNILNQIRLFFTLVRQLE